MQTLLEDIPVKPHPISCFLKLIKAIILIILWPDINSFKPVKRAYQIP